MPSYPWLKIPTIADLAHVSDVMYVLRFIQVTKPSISSRIIRFQVEQTNNIVALAVFMFILNILVKQTKFQCNRGFLSNRNFTIALSIDISDSGQCKVIHPSSDLHVFCYTEFEKWYVHRFTSLRRYIWHFLSKIKCFRFVSEGILKFLHHLTVSTLSIMTSFMGCLGTSNVANSQAAC